MILHPQVGHGGVWRQPCRPRLLAGRSLSSAALSWSDDDVYRSMHEPCSMNLGQPLGTSMAAAPQQQ